MAATQHTALLEVLRDRFATVDLLLSFAASALHSSRSTVVASPMPMERDAARQAMRELAAAGDRIVPASLSPQASKLLHFVCFPDVVSLRKVAVSKWAASATPSAARFPPDAVFEVEYGGVNDAWPNVLARQKHAEFSRAQLRKSGPTVVAYHGTELGNLHNVLREGLKNDAKLAGRNGAIFGAGIYLAEELDVATHFLRFGVGRSGKSVAVMLECEVVVEEGQVLRGDEAMSAGVPAKYIVVKNDCLVRPRRLLVYHHARSRDMRWLGSLLALLLAVALLLLMLVKKGTVPFPRLLFWQA